MRILVTALNYKEEFIFFSKILPISGLAKRVAANQYYYGIGGTAPQRITSWDSSSYST
jgi:hypothetical protein